MWTRPAAGKRSAGVLLGSVLHQAFQVLLAADAVAFAAAAVLLCALPGRRSTRTRAAPAPWKGLRDTRLLALTAYDALMCL